MRITAVHTAVVEANYDWTYVRVDADEDGLYGLGECFTAPGLTAIIRDLLEGPRRHGDYSAATLAAAPIFGASSPAA